MPCKLYQNRALRVLTLVISCYNLINLVSGFGLTNGFSRVVPGHYICSTEQFSFHLRKKSKCLFLSLYDENEDDLFDPSIIDDSFDDVSFEQADGDGLHSTTISVNLSQEGSSTNWNDLTVPELKRQLRLRGLKVSGKKSELVDRLFASNNGTGKSFASNGPDEEKLRVKNKEETKSSAVDVNNPRNQFIDAEVLKQSEKSPEQEFVEKKLGKELIDVSSYVDNEEEAETNSKDEYSEENEGVEVWGADAQIINDLDGVSPVVDNLSRTVIEYTGANADKVKAFVVASREALRGFLKGGSCNIVNPKETLKAEVSKINENRKLERIEWQGETFTVIQEGEKPTGYSMIGASISSQQVHGIIILSDVRGSDHEDTRTLCDKIAFECQPCVVMAPDLFRSKPWIEDRERQGFNTDGESYEEWRSHHPEGRVHFDIRTTAAVLRERYGVSSVNIFGTCFGGGRALEVATAWTPRDINSYLGESQSTVLPPLVEPASCIAWYPTRYDIGSLFENRKDGEPIERSDVAVMAIFAGKDDITGARESDAKLLKEKLDAQTWVVDNMVKVFDEEDHGFAHVGLANRDKDSFGNAEVASLLSTAWIDTYSRVYLPTTGPKVKSDDKWSAI